MDNLLEPKDVIALIGASAHDLKNWRRLAPDHPRHLASVRIDGRHYYDHNDLLAWLQRPHNSLFLERVIASFAPPHIRESFLPLARTRAPVESSGSIGAGLFGVGAAAA